MHQVIILTKDTIASGSLDKTIRVWNVNTDKEEKTETAIQQLKEKFAICSLLKLKDKNEIVSGGQGTEVAFWNTKTFKREHSVGCCDCSSLNGIIELPNQLIAVCGGYSSTIDVIDTKNYQRIKQIECKGYIEKSDYGALSSLHLLNNGTIIYSHDKCFCQILSDNYVVSFKLKEEKEFVGVAVTSSSNGEYIIADNWNNGITIFKVSYN